MTRTYRGERALLVLVAFVALAFAYGPGWPDVSRLALTQSVALDGTVKTDRYHAQSGDVAKLDGHWYSDKAPGISFLALPTFELMRLTKLAGTKEDREGIWHRRGLLLAARLATGGLAFLACLLLVGRAAEALRTGSGLPSAAAFGLGTMALPLAATTFGHLAAGALLFAAFLLARRSRPFAAGVCAATAVPFEYTAAPIAVAIAVYLVWRSRTLRSLAFFAIGLLPPAAALAVYDTAAFGSPFRVSYRYEAGPSVEGQHRGFYGIVAPHVSVLRETLFGSGRGLLTFSPVLTLAAAGLVLLWRRGLRAEAALCAVVAALYLLLTASYWDPFGGLAPGPRYVSPALLFLALGLAEAFARWPRLTAAATVASAAGMLYQAAVWGPNYDFSTVWWWLGLPRLVGALLVVAPCVAALALMAQDVGRLRLQGRRANAISVSQPDG